MIISTIRSKYTQLVAFLVVRFGPSSEQIKANYKRELAATAKAAFKSGTKLDRRVVAIEAIIEKLENEADRLSVLADEANLLHYRSNTLLNRI